MIMQCATGCWVLVVSKMYSPDLYAVRHNNSVVSCVALASFCLGRHWVCALVVIPWSSCNGDCGCRAQSASGRSSCRSGTQRLCRLTPRYPMLPSLVCPASSSPVNLAFDLSLIAFYDFILVSCLSCLEVCPKESLPNSDDRNMFKFAFEI